MNKKTAKRIKEKHEFMFYVSEVQGDGWRNEMKRQMAIRTDCSSGFKNKIFYTWKEKMNKKNV
jgi:hypothetical protein